MAESVILLDSHSSDDTAKIAKKSGIQVVQFNYQGGYPKKRQWALDHLKIKTPWVLLIDADEEVTAELWEEIREVIDTKNSRDAYFICKQFHFMGQKFRFGGFSFDAVLLFRKGKVRFENLIDEPKESMDMEIHERLIVKGTTGKMKNTLIHN